jgi:para-nitrobenzyl esterase
MPEPVAQTTSGKVRGMEKMGCLQFRGVPFAAPPVGERRWKSPEPHEGWDGVRETTEFGPICPQVTGTLERLGGERRQVHPMDEDCLTLNVFTPALDDGKRPVMLWIHGGAFSTGSGRLPWYYGHNFARDGVVLVTTNYRVSAFGFLHLEDLFGGEFRESGTVGTQDQIAALAWVRDNITAFGGDPGNVTIFGESAGGMSVGTLLAAPAAKGLFHKAIPQSGAAHSSHPRSVAVRVAERFCAEVGVAAGDANALRALPVEAILEGVTQLGQIIASDNKDLFGEEFAGFAMPFQPVFGGDVLPQYPIDAIRSGAGAGIPTLVGTTLEEWKLFTLMAGPDALRVRAPRPLRNLLAKAGRSVDELVAAYEQRLDPRSEGGADAPSGSEVGLRDAIETDRIFRIPAIRLAEAQIANDTPAWMYRFDWKTPAFGGRMGACHALEIPFVFDNLTAPGADVFTGNAAPPELATNMHAAWVAFAKAGDPNTDGLPDWPAYDTQRRATMLFDTVCRIEDDPAGDARHLWDGLL